MVINHLCEVFEHTWQFSLNSIFTDFFAMSFGHFGDWLEFYATRELSLDFSPPDQG